ncbi:hypothetical protein [Chlorobium limicola]
MPHHIVKRTVTFCSLLVCAAVGAPDKGYAADIAGGLKVSSLGAGIEGILGITSDLNLRISANAFSYGATTYKSGNSIAYDLNLLSFPVLLDWFPLGDDSGFRVSSGVIINNNEYKANAEPADSYDIGGVDYTAAEVGSLNGGVTFGSLAPYVGIGWGNPFTTESRLSFSFDLGIAFEGDPEVSMTASGPIASDPTFQANLQRETDDIKDEIEAFKYYPVVSVGIAYRF